MKTLAGALTATLLGIAMLVVGIAGVAGAFDSDDDDSAFEIDESCTSTDPRIENFTTLDVEPGIMLISCREGSYEATYGQFGSSSAKPQTIALWLSRGPRKHRLVDTRQLTYGDPVAITAPLPRETRRYRRFVITLHPEGVMRPKRPGRVLARAKL